MPVQSNVSTRQSVKLDEWVKELAPSTELRDDAVVLPKTP
jgi:uncharacterized protein YeaO (DUF488 family)